MIQTLILGMFGVFGVPELIILFVILLLFILPRIFYLVTLQKTLEKISSENRAMSPSNVWLELIPLFNLVWQFFNVINISDSLKKEFEAKGITIEEQRPAYSVGIAFCILTCCSIIPVVGVLTGIAGLICWIIFWVKVSNYKNML